MTFNAYMHKRNIYRNPPDFAQIALDFPELRTYAIPDAKGQKVRVDFTNPDALRTITKILLKKDFNLDIEIPQGFLIPTVPQRLNYILWIEDLLCNVPKKKGYVNGIDIGTGPCAIFPLLGAQKNGWKFVATESSVDAITWAEKNINKNNLTKNITVMKVFKDSTLSEVLSADDKKYEFCMCNPPFFENIEEIRYKHRNKNRTIADVAQKEEIFVKGGELDFVKNILKDSLVYKDRISLFTSMFGKKKNFLQIVKEIQEIKDAKFTTTEFCQGNTIRWGVAWTFNDSIHFEEQVKKKAKPKKTKPPLELQIPLPKSKNSYFETVVNQTESFLQFLQIPFVKTRSSENFAELLLKSDKNTWSHQRRRRRELERQNKTPADLEVKQSSIALNETDPILSKDCNSGEEISSPIRENMPSKNNIDLNDSCSESIIITEKNSVNRQAVKSENDQVNISENQLTENSDSSNINLFQNNKRKNDSISEDYINKKARIKEVTDYNTNDCSDVLFENINLDLKNSNNLVSTPIKVESVIDDTANIKDASSEKDRGNAFPSTTFEQELTFQNQDIICGSEVQCHSGHIIDSQNPSNSSNYEKFSSVEGKDSKLVSSFDSPISENGESSSLPLQTENDGTDQKLILHCHLQFIKGKSKIYIKMKCPATADRNTMHQVFQLIKNKIS